MLGLTISTTSMDEFANADLIMVLNAELTKNNLVADLKIKEAMKKGTQLISVSSNENPLARIADLWLDAKRGSNTALIAGLANALIKKGRIDKEFIASRTEGFAKYKTSIAKMDLKKTLVATAIQKNKFDNAVEMLSRAANIIIVYGIDQFIDKAKEDLQAQSNLLLQLGKIGRPGNGLILVHEYANSQGLLDMDFGQTTIAMLDKLKKKKIKALLVFGEDPLASTKAKKLLAGLEFKMVADFFMTKTAETAEVVLPLSSPLEDNGTYTACDLRFQRSAAVLPPLAGMTNLEIIGNMADKLGMDLKPTNPEDILIEIGAANPYYQGIEPGRFWGKDLFAEKFPTASGKAKFLPITIDLTACKEAKESVLSTAEYILQNIEKKLLP